MAPAGEHTTTRAGLDPTRRPPGRLGSASHRGLDKAKVVVLCKVLTIIGFHHTTHGKATDQINERINAARRVDDFVHEATDLCLVREVRLSQATPRS